jgi:hypothetical protein
MRRALGLAFLLTLAGCGAAPETERTNERTPLKGALVARSISLPDVESRFPQTGRDLLNNNCLACHSADMVLYQPRMSEAQWRAAIEKMRDTFHARIAETDVDGLVAELANLPAQRPN